MGILKKYMKEEYRWRKDDLILFHPTEVQLESIRELISENTSIDMDEGEATAEYGMKIIRYFLRELTSIGAEVDEYSDIELSNLLDDSKRELKLLMNEIRVLIEEITEDLINEQFEQIKLINKVFNILNLNSEIEVIETKFNKLSKKYDLGFTFEQMIEHKDDPQALALALKNGSKKKTGNGSKNKKTTKSNKK